jgi:hypothetical protein
MGSNATLVVERAVDGIYTAEPQPARAVAGGAGRADSVVDVSRPVLPWRWTRVLLAPVELLALAWSIPFAILLVGIPIALAVALIDSLGRVLSSYF